MITIYFADFHNLRLLDWFKKYKNNNNMANHILFLPLCSHSPVSRMNRLCGFGLEKTDSCPGGRFRMKKAASHVYQRDRMIRTEPSYPGIDFQFTHAKVVNAIFHLLDNDISSRWSVVVAVQTHSSTYRVPRILPAEWIWSSGRWTVRGWAVGNSTDEII